MAEGFVDDTHASDSCDRQFPSVVNLNVGGRHFTTSLSTLTKEPDSLLAGMFTGNQHINMDQDGRYFIDADPDVFTHILNYLRVHLLPPVDKVLSVYKHALQFELDGLAHELGSYAEVNRETALMENKAQHPDYDNILSQVLTQLIHIDTFTFNNKANLRKNWQQASANHNNPTCPICSKGTYCDLSLSSMGNEASLARLLQNDLKRKGYLANIEKHGRIVHLTVHT